MRFSFLALTPPSERSFVSKVSIVLLTLLVALGFRYLLGPYLGDRGPFALLLLATLVSALYGGWQAGAVSNVVGGIASLFVFVQPKGMFFAATTGDIILLLIFLVQGGIVTTLCGALHYSVSQSRKALRQAVVDFEAMADHAEIFIWSSDSEDRTVFVNRHWLTFTGRSIETESQDRTAAIHPEDRAFVLASSKIHRADRVPFQTEYRLLGTDGEYRWVLEHAVPRYGPNHGFEGYIGSCTDITNSKRERERLAFITNLQRSLSRSLDLDDTIEALVDTVVPSFADWCCLQLIDEEGTLKSVRTQELTASNLGKSSSAAGPGRKERDRAESTSRILGQNEARLVPQVSDAFLTDLAADAEDLDNLRSLEMVSFLVTPLRARDRLIGVISFATAKSKRIFGPDDLALSQKIAVISAYALDNARLYETTRTALAAEEQARRERYLSEEALERQRLLLKTIIDAVPAMVAYIDPNERFLVHNRQYEKWMGVSYDQVHGRTLKELLGIQLYETGHEHLKDALAGNDVRFERVMTTPEGLRDIVVSYHPDFDGTHAVNGVVIHAYDITESRRMETAVARSENRYRTLISATASIVWTTDAAGRLLEAAGWQAFTGQTPANYRGEGWLDPIHPTDREGVRLLWQRTCQERSTWDCMYRLKRSDGVFRHIHSRGAVVTDSAGQTQEWIGTIVDIHDRVEAEQALYLKESELKLIVDAMPALVAYVHGDGTFGRANQTYKKWFGIEPETLRNRHILEIIGEDAYAADLSRIEVVMSGEEVHFEQRVNYRFGPPRWISGTYVPHINEDFTVVGYVALMIDITERRRSEQELADALERYRFLADAMPQVVWTAKPDGNIDYVNRRWPDLTGMRESTFLMPAGWLSALHPDDRESTHTRWKEAVANGVSWEHNFRLKVARENSYRWQLMRAVPRLGTDGKIEQWVGTATDIDAQRRAYADLDEARELLRHHADQLEDQVRIRTASLQESNSELEAFSYSVSHDLRTPLRFVRGFTEAIVEESGASLPPQTRDYLQRILNAVQRMDTIINDLLSYSRLSRSEMQVIEQSLEAIVSEVVALQHTQIQQAKAKVVVETPLPKVLADRTGLFQALSNLVSNALKFTPPGKEPVIRIRTEVRLHTIRLWVEDNGIGIDPRHHERIFKLFERLHGTSEFPGTGIGLSLVKKAVLRMGGTCGVESVMGEGSRFWIDFPKANKPDRTTTKIAP